MNRRIALWLMVGAMASGGCAAFHPLKGIPAHKLPDEYRCPQRNEQATIDLSLLRQTPPLAHLVDSGDVLGIYIEGLLGRDGDVPPIYLPNERSMAPSVGYPIAVQPDGTISIPSLGPLSVRGLTIRQVEDLLRHECVAGPRAILQKGTDRILVSLQRPRMYAVLVIRQEASNPLGSVGIDEDRDNDSEKRGTGQTVLLPAYKNDVLNALAETGGLPGLDAQNAVYIVRGQRAAMTGPPQQQFPGIKVRGQSPSGMPVPAATVARGPQPVPSNKRAGGWSQPAMSPYQSYRDPSGPRFAPPGGPGLSSPAFSAPQASIPFASTPAGVIPVNHVAPEFPLPPQTPSPMTVPLSPIPHVVSAPDAIIPQPFSGAYPQAGSVPSELSWITSGAANPTVLRIPLRQYSGESPSFHPHDVILQDGDIVFVESRDSEFFYTGGLLGGGQYTLPRDYDVNVLDAISISEARGKHYRGNSLSVGGVSALNHDVTVGASKVVISRRQPDGSQLNIEVDLYRAMRDPDHRVIIYPEDRIYLRYTRIQAVLALFERHLLEGFLIGAATSTLYN